MSHPTRPYVFFGATTALCATCLQRVEAKEVIEDGRAWLLKRCPRHGRERVLLAEDAAWWVEARTRWIKPPEQVLAANTPVRWGCPYDCGICPEHEQHGCVTVVEITDACNLRCPVCYAGSGPEHAGRHRPLAQVEAMLDRCVANEGEADVVQISGGEPSEHPGLFAILDACRRRPIVHLMLNTNGVRIAREDGFAERLAGYAPGFEIYLQFDGTEPGHHLALRGADLLATKLAALDRLDRLGLSTTLVATVRQGVNDDALGRLLEFALTRPCVRGVVLQPVQDAGRSGGQPPEQRLTLTGVRRRLLEQTRLFAPEDVVPVPCHPDCLAMAYGLRQGGGLVPLTGLVGREVLVGGGRNSITVERDPAIRAAVVKAFSTAHGPQGAAAALQRLLCCLPGVACAPTIAYRDVFRLVIMKFLDRHDLDLRSVRKACVHIVHPDAQRVIPFDTYNVLYRGELEQRLLEPLRRAAGAG